jgi:hypothetical protein
MSYDASAPDVTPTPPVTIVDSPIAADNIPVIADQGATGDLTSPASDVTPAAPVVPAPPAPDAWKQELSGKFGVAVDGFTNRADALAAVRLLAERAAIIGHQQQFADPAPVQQIPAQPAAPAQAVDLAAIDLSNADPALAQYVQALQQQTAAALAQAQEAQKGYQSFQQAQQQKQIEVAAQRAEAVLDGLASPKYGVGQNRTFQQLQNVENLGRYVQKILTGFASQPGAQPTIEEVLHLALELDGYEAAPAKPVAPTGVPSGTAALVQRALGGNTPNIPAPRFKDPNDPLGLKNDPGFMAGVKAALAQHR